MEKPIYLLFSILFFFGFCIFSSDPLYAEPSNQKNVPCSEKWYSANLTTYSSYPEKGSTECTAYNGCTWSGQFYGLDDKKSEQWVASHNIVSVHKKDWNWLGLKTLHIRQGNKFIEATVFDLCDDEDCQGCCTKNLGKDGFLIDMESYTVKRFGTDEGKVTFQVCP